MSEKLTRREFLKRAAVIAGGSIAFGGALDACTTTPTVNETDVAQKLQNIGIDIEGCTRNSHAVGQPITEKVANGNTIRTYPLTDSVSQIQTALIVIGRNDDLSYFKVSPVPKTYGTFVLHENERLLGTFICPSDQDQVIKAANEITRRLSQ